MTGKKQGSGKKETKYDTPQDVSKSGSCRKSGCREEVRKRQKMITRRVLSILGAAALAFTASVCGAKESSAKVQNVGEQEEIVLLADNPESGMKETDLLSLSEEQLHK